MNSRLQSLKIKAKLLQKAKKRSGNDVQLKEAYEILAKAAGYSSWREYKAAIEKTSYLVQPPTGPQLRSWFANREEALNFAKQENGYVIPYEKDFFVADSDYLASIGIDSNDEDLLQVGRDWSQPHCEEAFQKLCRKMKIPG